MGAYSRVDMSAGASLAQVVTQTNTNTSAIAAVINSNIEGGSGNNIKSATVTRLEMANNASVGKFFGDVHSTNAHVLKGGTVAKVSGLVYSVADGRWYMTNRAVTPFETYQQYKTSIPNNSVVANRRTFLDMGFDGVIDRNDVALGADGPPVQDGHIRFARISASAAITNVTMLANSGFAAGAAWPTGYRANVQVHAGSSTASAARYLIIRKGTKARSSQNNMNIEATADIILDKNVSGAGGRSVAMTASTAYFVHLIGDPSGANIVNGIIHNSSSAPSVSSYAATAWLTSRVTGSSNNIYPVDTVGEENYLRRQRNLGTSDVSGYDSYNIVTNLKLKSGHVKKALMTFGSTSADPAGGEFVPGGVTVPISGSSTYKVYMGATGLSYSSMPPVWVPIKNGVSINAKALGAVTITVILRGYAEKIV